jgi:carbamoyltransferase
MPIKISEGIDTFKVLIFNSIDRGTVKAINKNSFLDRSSKFEEKKLFINNLLFILSHTFCTIIILSGQFTVKMNLLGISAYFHDSAAALICKGKIIAAAQEERFTRIKNDSSFPKNAISFCLQFGGLGLEDIDYIVFYEKPFLKFERILETFYAVAPKGITSFLSAIPIWIEKKLFLKSELEKQFNLIEPNSNVRKRLKFSHHHLSHAASAYYTSGFSESAILTIDGVGEWSTVSIFKGANQKIEQLKEIQFPHSIGLFYSAFTYFLGFEVNKGEYKLMGLAPYGNRERDIYKKFYSIIEQKLISFNTDKSFTLNQKHFSYTRSNRMVNDRQWKNMFGFKKREPNEKIEFHHCDLALAVQDITERVILELVRRTRELVNSNNLCLAGGVALNCVANGKIVNSDIFENVFVFPAAGDAGGAVGGALSFHYTHFHEMEYLIKSINHASWGPEYRQDEINKLLNRRNIKFELYDSKEELVNYVSDMILSGKVVGWFQGRMEFGPRALGNRSILASALHPEMQKIINDKVKFREDFRPFAPAVLEEDSQNIFNLKLPSPFMQLVADVKSKWRVEQALPVYNTIEDQLDHRLSFFPSITHVDFSARIQTVNKSNNALFYNLLLCLKRKSGHGIVLNTSFNRKDEPIVCSPEDALECFANTHIDILVLGQAIIIK